MLEGEARKALLSNLSKHGRSKKDLNQCLVYAKAAGEENDVSGQVKACQAAANIVGRSNENRFFDLLLNAAKDSADIRLGLVGSHTQLMKLPLDGKQRDDFAKVIAQTAIEGDGIYADYLVGLAIECADNEELKTNLLLDILLKAKRMNVRDYAEVNVRRRVSIDEVDGLRQRFWESCAKGEIDHPVFRTLSYIGDQTILQELKDCMELESRCGISSVDLEWAIKKIELQHPPEQLLDALRDPSRRGLARDRVWLMERAVAAGMPLEDIRSALLVYVSRRADEQSRAWTRERKKLVEHGRRLGVVSDSVEAQIPKGPPAAVHRGRVD